MSEMLYMKNKIFHIKFAYSQRQMHTCIQYSVKHVF